MLRMLTSSDNKPFELLMVHKTRHASSRPLQHLRLHFVNLDLINLTEKGETGHQTCKFVLIFLH